MRRELLVVMGIVGAIAGCDAATQAGGDEEGFGWLPPGLSNLFFASDGTTITATRDAQGRLNGASGTDASGVQRRVQVTPYFSSPDQNAWAHLAYTENGAAVLDLTLSMSPAGHGWGLSAQGRTWQGGYRIIDISEPQSPNTSVDAAPIQGTMHDIWNGQAVKLSGWCDLSQHFCPLPGLWVYQGAELDRLAYFAPVLQAAASVQVNAANTAWSATGRSLDDLWQIPYSYLNLEFHPTSQKAAGYGFALLIDQVTPHGTIDGQALEWLAGFDGASWNSLAWTVAPMGTGGGGGGGGICVRDATGVCEQAKDF